MPKREDVSISVIRRLPRYYRVLGDLIKAGTVRISSRELAQIMRLTASQIRQDLNCFGGFGQQGYGYNVATLQGEIGNILGIDQAFPLILIGAGNLGQSVARHVDFPSKGFRLIGAFDSNPRQWGKTIRGVTVQDTANLEHFCGEYSPRVAMMCTPTAGTPEIVAKLVGLGIQGFWNFSNYDILADYPDVSVENVHIGDSLMTLCYQMNKQLEKPKEK